MAKATTKFRNLCLKVEAFVDVQFANFVNASGIEAALRPTRLARTKIFPFALRIGDARIFEMNRWSCTDHHLAVSY